MSDELASVAGISGGGGALGGILLVKLLDRFFKKSDDEVSGIKKTLEMMRQEHAALHAQLLERVNEALADHKSRLHALEREVNFLRGRDEGYRAGMKDVSGSDEP